MAGTADQQQTVACKYCEWFDSHKAQCIIDYSSCYQGGLCIKKDCHTFVSSKKTGAKEKDVAKVLLLTKLKGRVGMLR